MYSGYEYPRESSLRHKFKSSIFCFSATIHDYHQPQQQPQPICYKKSGQESPESYRFRCRRFVSRMCHKHHRRIQSAEFSYDPSSYALNFEDESRVEEFPFRDFASRLPPSPSNPPVRPIIGFSPNMQ
ncbi:hypothetical protein L6164_020928 [Bauhinia variegata]|uniref:Uncharacterized protein n=1 Tax=Bauhinia variegata TaxID=167791 RepID=A0ACB9MWK3_BAUVA|nr:hypothetical protein L6164_020928 [Bauhinia variegata]